MPSIGMTIVMGVPVYFMNFLPVHMILRIVLQIISGIVIYIGLAASIKYEPFIYLKQTAMEGIAKIKK